MNTVLIVDTDGKALASTQRKLRKHFETHIALGPRLGLQRLMEEGPYAVVIAEFSMDQMDGVDFLAQVRELWPHTTRILLSRAAMDVADLLRVINDCEVFRLLSASCDDATLLSVAENGIDRYNRICASTRSLNDTHAVFAKAVHEIVCWLRGEVRDMISPMLPLLRGLCQKLNDPSPVSTETAFLLSVIGLIALPPALLEKIIRGQELTEEERLIFAGHPAHAVELIRHLPQVEEVVEILRGYSNFLHLSLLPDSTEPSEKPNIPPGSALLALVMEYRLALYANQETAAIISRLGRHAMYTSVQLKALEAELAGMDQSAVEVMLDKLLPGMILAKSVTGVREGKEVELVPMGYELSRTTIVFLRQSARHGQVREPFYVRGSSLIPQAGNGNA